MTASPRPAAGRLRVLYVIDSLGAGGAETSLAALAPHLIAGGVDLDVAYFVERPGLQDQLREAGARLIPLTEATRRAGRVRAVRRLVVGRRPDLVHTTLFEADVAGRLGARLGGVRVVSSIVGEPYGPEHRQELGPSRAWKLQLAHALDAATAQLAARFQANSHASAETMRQRLHVPAARIDVVHRGRDAHSLGRRTKERRLLARRGLRLDDGPVVLAVGRQEPQKGLDVLLRAAPSLLAREPPPVILIAGREGTQTAALQKLAAGAGRDAVRFLGHRSDVADLMCAADVLAFPSLREGLPGTLIEAMALECPIVATDIAPVREVVGEVTPCAGLVPPGDVGALAAAVAAVLQSPCERGGQVADGRRRFLDQFTIERSAEGMLAFYRRALAA